MLERKQTDHGVKLRTGDVVARETAMVTVDRHDDDDDDDLGAKFCSKSLPSHHMPSASICQFRQPNGHHQNNTVPTIQQTVHKIKQA